MNQTPKSLRRILIILILIDALMSFSPDILGIFNVSIRPMSIVAIGEASAELPAALELALNLIFCISLFASYIGLVLSWRFARPLYLFCWVLSVAMIGVTGPIAFTALGIVLTNLVGFSGGFLVCLIYFTDLRYAFMPNRDTISP